MPVSIQYQSRPGSLGPTDRRVTSRGSPIVASAPACEHPPMADNQSRAGKRYANVEVIDYLNRVHTPHETATEAAFRAPAAHDMPAIMVSPTEGKTVELLLRMIGATRVVEVGTLAGYSAIRMAAALPPGGRLWTIEYDARHVEVARAAVAKAGYSEVIEVLHGAGLDILPTLTAHGPFDAVFIDADKGNYDRYGEWAVANLRPGGLLLGDNAYLFGNLLDDSDTARAMRRFHEHAAAHCHSVCLSTPDGMLLAIKK